MGKEALAERALLAPPAWTHEDSARVTGLRDRLTLRTVLDSVLAAAHARLRAAGDSTADAQAVGVAAREELVARLAPRWDDEALGRTLEAFRALPRPSADSGVMAQMRMLSVLPRLEPADSARVLARTARGDYRASELLAWWGRLDPLGRPRIEDLTQMRDLAANALFERALRDEAALRGVADRPEVTRAIERQTEFIAVEHLVAREVYARIAMDSLTLRRHYERHREDYGLPVRLRVIRLVLGDRASATEMALRLRVEADAESLLARAARRGVRYDEDLSAARDSALFARGLRAGPGAVLGPDSVAAGWQVVRVRVMLPARTRTFEESRTFVENDWYGREGERLMNALLERCRKAVPIRLNERALAHLTSP